MMRVWRQGEKDYWHAGPPETVWAATIAEAGEMQGLKTAMHVLGDATDEQTPIMVVVEYPPNYVLARHAHASNRLELVIKGSIQVDGQWFGPGDIWSSPAEEFYGPHTMGADGCTTMELATVAGAHRIIFDVDGTALGVDFNEPASLAELGKILQ